SQTLFSRLRRCNRCPARGRRVAECDQRSRFPTFPRYSGLNRDHSGSGSQFLPRTIRAHTSIREDWSGSTLEWSSLNRRSPPEQVYDLLFRFNQTEASDLDAGEDRDVPPRDSRQGRLNEIVAPCRPK